jgi:hypothetical protein
MIVTMRESTHHSPAECPRSESGSTDKQGTDLGVLGDGAWQAHMSVEVLASGGSREAGEMRTG